MQFKITDFGKNSKYVTGNLALVRNVEEIKKTRRESDKKKKKEKSQLVYPFKNKEDIQAMKGYFLSKKRIRDYTLFVTGINIGLRCGDLLGLKWEQILFNNNFKMSHTLIEQKTGKERTIFLNKEVIDALTMLKNRMPEHKGYIFKSQRADRLTVDGVNTMLKKAARVCNIPYNVGTHSMRKTWGYHQMQAHRNDMEFLVRLQRMFNHSSTRITEHYIGIEDDQNKEIYNSIGL